MPVCDRTGHRGLEERFSWPRGPEEWAQNGGLCPKADSPRGAAARPLSEEWGPCAQAASARFVPQFSHAAKKEKICARLHRQCGHASQAWPDALWNCFLGTGSGSCIICCKYATYFFSAPGQKIFPGNKQKPRNNVALHPSFSPLVLGNRCGLSGATNCSKHC